MRTIDINLGKIYTLGSYFYDDVRLLHKFVEVTPSVKTDINDGIAMMCLSIALSFSAYRRSIPFYRIFKKYRYWRLSDWRYVKKSFTVEAMQMLSKGVEYLEPKIARTKEDLKKKDNEVSLSFNESLMKEHYGYSLKDLFKMQYSDFLDELENAYKIESFRSGNVPNSFMTRQEVYTKKKAEIDYLIGAV